MKIIMNHTQIQVENFQDFLAAMQQFPDNQEELMTVLLDNDENLINVIHSLSHLRAAKDYPAVMLPFIEKMLRMDSPLAYLMLMAATKELPTKAEELFKQELSAIDFVENPVPGFEAFQCMIKEYPKLARMCLEAVVKKEDEVCFKWLIKSFSDSYLFDDDLEPFVRILKQFPKLDRDLLLKTIFENTAFCEKLFKFYQTLIYLMQEIPGQDYDIVTLKLNSGKWFSRFTEEDRENFVGVLSKFTVQERSDFFQKVFKNPSLYKSFFNSCWDFFDTIDRFPEQENTFITFMISDFDAFRYFTDNGDMEEDVCKRFYNKQQHLHLIEILLSLKSAMTIMCHPFFTEDQYIENMNLLRDSIVQCLPMLIDIELRYLFRILDKELESTNHVYARDMLDNIRKDVRTHIKSRLCSSLVDSCIFEIVNNSGLFKNGADKRHFNLLSLPSDLQEEMESTRLKL